MGLGFFVVGRKREEGRWDLLLLLFLFFLLFLLRDGDEA